MSSSAKAAADGAMGSKAARACDGCLRRRARWYCAADDAFLCQGCDTSVHSANPLARRHERVRLRPTSPLLLPQQPAGASAPPPREKRRGEEVVPAWIKRKARTPRSQAKSVGQLLSRRLVVPDASSGGESPEGQKCGGETDEEAELLYHRVPVFDHALAELCSSPSAGEESTAVASCCGEDGGAVVDNLAAAPLSPVPAEFMPVDGLVSFGPTDAELMEFAADMEALLGRPGMDDGGEEEPFCMEALGLIDPTDASVKLEADGCMLACGLEQELDVSGDIFDLDFDYCSPQAATPDENAASSDGQLFPKSLALNLNYEAIIEKWESSPFADGERPDVKLEDCWPHDDYSLQAGAWMMGGGGQLGYGGDGVGTTPRLRMGADGGREARVSRYREKRRTRLFSKKIRYEVRKLNAEKRPRMKGRFVKRLANGAVAATACVA
ncbi:zinc finger protein CONSTANS-LIKE 16-like [Lolium perenne]|uniref:zinc finger protein CONSTANS-LIKE 16-like n=1 Tax=Lolium perenne TaxID=4522 RepID=UPI0021EA77DD|nr:zinc finger protein CONSTANS-LIKE 16-like [Lolium perenne]